ncbi:MAG: zinc-ribbon domain containing protein [Selenomonadales bacterium]|jgi:CxxC-x17-CxxC domain-containing protein|nr:zinc-ribbon domain containing protein [Selenomonadales bacterium]MBQ2246986.1 zinc-ribbon domain containing protein [Selenomonadales bacterium]MBQ5636941.1 zinc-ribbon domain containing protein [Selenomonadales bacterium]MBQ5832914.1 zinc-ribbon domain containing protein [Selenomonadales bacterium]MBR0325152.1 zinc-ribbon domain containing protein [Selenomonadales bacterium]
MTYQDEVLTCKDCGAEFVFSASEQEFYAEKGFQNKPGRCPACRAARKAQRGDAAPARPQRELFDAVCSECGCETKVPFKPTEGKPVYCRDCFQARRKY